MRSFRKIKKKETILQESNQGASSFAFGPFFDNKFFRFEITFFRSGVNDAVKDNGGCAGGRAGKERFQQPPGRATNFLTPQL